MTALGYIPERTKHLSPLEMKLLGYDVAAQAALIQNAHKMGVKFILMNHMLEKKDEEFRIHTHQSKYTGVGSAYLQ